ncbi:hypothetical protein FK535_07265 [Mycolicibacterium sp. 018/SC-01/001]|uniref:DUF6603 domain-containing protein n=1 Tax=Mycolicibacterium sp. 018/SC-01/001 TaxID=2592069 RepID=UPI00117DD12E|nr:DUF6603 domain-containing protein [Mycolicibacterium sp. 018/SC-01/001]TRW86255.1 hypothetical protein FK535_07265 [Mycolicibacterium sp. 018/SC-01/001]
MADSGTELLRLLRTSLTQLLADALAELERTAGLPALGPAGPDWADCGFADHLLAPVDDGMSANPVTQQVISAMRKLAGVAGPGAFGGLFGWEPDPVGHTADRGIACAVKMVAVGGQFAAAVVVTKDGDGARLDIVAKGDKTAHEPLAIDDVWSLDIGGHASDVVEIHLPPSGHATVTRGSNGDTIRVGLVRKKTAPGVGPGIDLGDIALTAALTLDGDTPKLAAGLQIRNGQVRVAPGDLAGLIPALAPTPLDVDLALSDSDGVSIAGSPTLAVRLCSGASMPGVQTGPLDVELVPRLEQPPSVGVRVTCAIALDLPAVPIHLDVDGNGFEVPFRLGGPSLAFDLANLVPHSPTGADVGLALPIVKGAGEMSRIGDAFTGMLSVEMTPMSVTALGTLDVRTGALLVVLGAAFPLPGIQIGFGFAVTGVGGIVGVSRRLDRDALTRAVQDGTAGSLLFPTDPAKAARDVVPMLDRVFPRSPGSVIVGPMFQISWGGNILTGSVALIAELPDPVRLSILGKLLLAVPDPALPLIKLQITFFGQIDPSVPSLTFLASLTDSTIAGIPVTGDMFVLVQGGSDANVVVSAGGFHPRYSRPAGVPALKRVSLTLSSGPFLQLRCSAYVALTSNTLQFGALAELVAEVAGCGLRGHLGFDVLIQFSPFHFVAEISAAIAVEVLGETLVGIALRLSLEGPGRWRAVGRGSVDLFLFSASFDFDESWGGTDPALTVGPDDLREVLTAALLEPEAWRAYAPDPSALPVQLTVPAGAALADGRVLHPHGTLSVRQKDVPLGIDIDRFNRVPIPKQRWDVTSPVLGDGRPAPVRGEEREQFAPAAFLTMTDDEQIARPAFEMFKAGLTLVAGEVVLGDERATDFDYETKVISEQFDVNQTLDVKVGALVDAVEAAAGAGLEHARWWRTDRDTVTVADSPTYVVVNSWSLSEAVDIAQPSPNATEVYEAAAAASAADPRVHVEVAEAWELSTS